MRFLGLSESDSALNTSRYVVLPVPFESTTTYGQGTALGPDAIISASQEVELYDEELHFEPFKSGIHTSETIDLESADSEQMVRAVRNRAAELISADKCVITLGGEHTVSIGAVAAYAEAYPRLSVLQIDAHADLRESYQENRLSHACAMKRIRDYTNRTVGVGIRNLSVEEAELVEREAIDLYYAQDIVGRRGWRRDVVEKLTDDVYVTIDLDGFDPSIIPGVGTPEPGGLGWYETLELLRTTAENRNIVGFDIVELMPIPGSLVSQFTAAKLIYKLIAYIESLRS